MGPPWDEHRLARSLCPLLPRRGGVAERAREPRAQQRTSRSRTPDARAAHGRKLGRRSAATLSSSFARSHLCSLLLRDQLAARMSAIKTGLGERLVSASLDAAAFTQLPIISLARLNGSLDDRKALAAEVRLVSPSLLRAGTKLTRAHRPQIQDAAVNTGFMYISDHGADQEVIDAAFDQAKQFFAQPTDKKMLVRDAESFRGFAPLKGENVDPASRGDIHEAWDMGDDSQVMKEGSNHGNMWPPADDLPDFKPTLQKTWCVPSPSSSSSSLWARALDRNPLARALG